MLNAALAEAQANLTMAEARSRQAALNLSHTEIRAPFDGVIGNKTVALGDYLQPGTQIMAVVPLAQVYILANYKETQITNIRPGQKVDVDVDAFPNLQSHRHGSTASPPTAARNSRCCRPTTRPAISPRSCSACR